MLTFSEYRLLEQYLTDYAEDKELDEGIWNLLGKLGPKPIPKEKIEKDILKVNQLRDPKKVADALHPKNPLHIVMAAAKHELLPKDAMADNAKDDRHNISVSKILQNRLEKLATA